MDCIFSHACEFYIQYHIIDWSTPEYSIYKHNDVKKKCFKVKSISTFELGLLYKY